MKIRKVYEDIWADLEAKELKDAQEAEEYISDNLEGSKLMNFINLQNEYLKTNKEILKLVHEYIEIRNDSDTDDQDYWLGQYGFSKNDIKNIDIKKDKYGELTLYLKARFKDNPIVMRSVDFKEFLKYIENAEIYKNSKKFNI